MKQVMLILCCFVVCLLQEELFAQRPIVLQGKVHNRDERSFYLVPRAQSYRAENKIEVPINNGEFRYTLSSDKVEAYELIYREELEKGAWQPVVFFTDTAVIGFDLFPAEKFSDNEVHGGSANRAYYNLVRRQRELFDQPMKQLGQQERALKSKGMYNTPAFEAIMTRIRNAKSMDERQGYYEERAALEKSGGHLAPAGLAVSNSFDSLNRLITTWKYQQMFNGDNIAYLYIMFADAQFSAKTKPYVANAIEQTFPRYARLFPGHPYTIALNDALVSLAQVFPGKTFIDVAAPDLEGRSYQLSALIKDKVALIDLWGSWCGPCIAKSRKVVPLYEKYKERGFTVVGIAREFDNTKELKKRLAQENFSWKHLVELDDRQGIWNKYGIPNSGGMVVLVNRDGKILSVNPTQEELETQLASVIK